MADERKRSPIFTQEQILKLLDELYEKSINGISRVSPPIEEFAKNYLDKDPDNQIAAKKMINNQVLKCTTSGVITGFGGLITLPVAVPANVSSVLYVQMRMIACAAYMGGYDTHSDQVQSLVYACLAGVAVNQIIKKIGIKAGEKLAENLIKKLPGAILVKINQKVGFRLLTKFGTKGLINLGKMVPGVGAAISGAFDFGETRIIGKRAYNWFLKGDFTLEGEDRESKDDDINVIDDEDDIPPKRDDDKTDD